MEHQLSWFYRWFVSKLKAMVSAVFLSSSWACVVFLYEHGAAFMNLLGPTDWNIPSGLLLRLLFCFSSIPASTPFLSGTLLRLCLRNSKKNTGFWMVPNMALAVCAQAGCFRNWSGISLFSLFLFIIFVVIFCILCRPWNWAMNTPDPPRRCWGDYSPSSSSSS